MDKEKIRKTVRKGYGKIARDSCRCGPGAGSCCGGEARTDRFFADAGYSAGDLAGLPEGALVGLACGNPLSFAKPAAGETVLDLGSGPGLDCFIASRTVGPSGRVVGVDMTPEMIDRARENAASGGYKNVEFRLGEIEHLPAADGSVDIVISNCVIRGSVPRAPGRRKARRLRRRSAEAAGWAAPRIGGSPRRLRRERRDEGAVPRKDPRGGIRRRPRAPGEGLCHRGLRR